LTIYFVGQLFSFIDYVLTYGGTNVLTPVGHIKLVTWQLVICINTVWIPSTTKCSISIILSIDTNTNNWRYGNIESTRSKRKKERTNK